jgi:uncharacterized membrane protein (DUF4010 family)
VIETAWARLGIALLIGALIGVERGFRTRSEASGSRVAGIRTFSLLGLTGGLCGSVAIAGYDWLAALLLGFAATPVILGYWRKSRAPDRLSATGALAAVMTLTLGAMSMLGFAVQAVAAACIVTLILASRRQLHGWLSGLSETEMQAIARFALIAAAIWPFLPAGSFGPFGALSPRALWGVVVLVTGFSLAGYIANKHFGHNRGTFATSALGGLYSSTAVIAALSNRLRQNPEASRTIGAGIAIASAVMFTRVLALTALLAPRAWLALAIAIGPAALLALILALWSVRHASAQVPPDGTTRTGSGRNPVELLPALGFALLVAVTAIATRWAESAFGGSGAGAVIMITGSFDVDAAIVTLGGMPAQTFSPRDAGLILAVPVLANTLFKAAIVLTAGGSARWSASRPLLAASAAILLAVGASLLF